MNRFIYHDHINRLFKGVHSTDDGAFEYFFQWLGYGAYPLIALVPLALAFALTRAHSASSSEIDELEVAKSKKAALKGEQSLLRLVSQWALIGYTLFSKSSTKYHHNIFDSPCDYNYCWFLYGKNVAGELR